MTHKHSEYPTYLQGFTLIELLIVLILAGILATWGIPGLQSLSERTAVTSEVNRLQTALTLARSTAITQHRDITLCPATADRSACARDWGNELMVVSADKTRGIHKDEIIRVFPSTNGVNVSKNGHARIKYTPLGHATGFNSTFSICPASTHNSTVGASLVLSTLGRARIAEPPASC